MRPVLYYYEDSFFESLGVSIFFISFIIINAVVLMNVVVAVLIDGMSKPESSHNEHHAVEENDNANWVANAMRSSLVSVALDTADATADITVDNDLSRRNWLQRWMHPDTCIPKHHKKNMLAARSDLLTKVALLQAEATSLRDELAGTMTDMRRQLEELIGDVRETIEQERMDDEIASDEEVEERLPRGINGFVESNPATLSLPEDTVLYTDDGQSNGVHPARDPELTAPGHGLESDGANDKEWRCDCSSPAR